MEKLFPLLKIIISPKLLNKTPKQIRSFIKFPYLCRTYNNIKPHETEAYSEGRRIDDAFLGAWSNVYKGFSKFYS